MRVSWCGMFEGFFVFWKMVEDFGGGFENWGNWSYFRGNEDDLNCG